MNAWSRRRSYSLIGKSGSTDANPASKWFLKVWIALSAMFAWWVWDGTNWNVVLYSVIAAYKSWDVSLSRIQIFGADLEMINLSWMDFQAVVIVFA